MNKFYSKFCHFYVVSFDGKVCNQFRRFPGDSGGGLVFPKIENNRKKYYIRGIASGGPIKGDSCDGGRYSVFTNILYYENLISTYEPRYRPR